MHLTSLLIEFDQEVECKINIFALKCSKNHFNP